ncbi:MAG: hypothetical protein AB1489_22590 [Acidobacteriota bacterium]
MASKERRLSVYILKQVLLAFSVAAIILAIYLAATNQRRQEDYIGKHAYITTNGSYLGTIKGRGRSTKSSQQVYFIKELTGAVIEIPVQYVEVRAKPPTID